MKCINLLLLLGVSSVPLLYATRSTSVLVLGLHHYPNDDHLISHDTYPVSLSLCTAANLSLIDAQKYRDDILTPFFEQLTDNECQSGCFQQDSAMAHTADEALNLIQEIFEGRIISVHRCGASGSMHPSHAAGPGSIPGRDKFPG